MKTGTITITDNGEVSIIGNVLMRPFEIADLFGVYISTVNANIRSIVKSGIVRPDMQHGAAAINGATILPEFFDLDMITALAFRINSHKAEIFRKWVMKKAITKTVDKQIQVIVQCGNKLFIC